MKPVGTWVVVAQQGRLVLQLAPKCPIFHGSAEPSATDAWTYRESTSLPVLYSLLMTTHIIAIVAAEARRQREVTFTLVGSLNWKNALASNILCLYTNLFHDYFCQKERTEQRACSYSQSIHMFWLSPSLQRGTRLRGYIRFRATCRIFAFHLCSVKSVFSLQQHVQDWLNVQTWSLNQNTRRSHFELKTTEIRKKSLTVWFNCGCNHQEAICSITLKLQYNEKTTLSI